VPNIVEGGDGFSSATTALCDKDYIHLSQDDISDSSCLSADLKFSQYCIIQSKEILDTSNQSSESTQQNVTFSSGVDEQILSLPTTIKDCQIDTSYNVELGSFLSRPVLIQSYTWAEGTSFNESFSPWLDYFSNSTIKKKLDNYYLLRCNLHIKFVINASPFYYSAIMCSYRPLSDLFTGTSFNPAPVVSGVGLELLTIMGRSQRPKTFLYPQNSEGSEMVLPFLYFKNWFDATLAEDLENMGTINMDSMFAPLQNANSVSGGVVDIQVYAWAEELELAGPTLTLAIQSTEQVDDEYEGKGAVSAPASAVAKYANILGNFPYIGPFATATSMTASTIADVAKLFGFTNVPVIENVHSFKPQPLPQMATTQIGVPCEKLTLDPKNELTIDPRVDGVDLGDDMLINKIATKESFLSEFTWESTDSTDFLLFNATVRPGYTQGSTVSSVLNVQGTPGWMIQQLFSYWRGDMIYRFKFLCTKYHRGRVRISWDPRGDVSGIADSTTQIYNKIVDITQETDVEFIVPYTQPTSFLSCPIQGQSNTYGTTPRTSSYGIDNGVITIRVLNAQTSSVLNAPIECLVFVRCADNIEFAAPVSPPQFYSNYTIQSTEISYENPQIHEMGMKPSKANQNLSLIHMGEKIVSLRQLMRRQNFMLSQSNYPTNADAHSYMSFTNPRMPYYYGYDPSGIHIANDTLGAGTSPFNYVQVTTLNWVNQCYVGHKGSVIWNVNAASVSTNPLAQFYVIRNLRTLSVANSNSAGSNPITTNDQVSYRSRLQTEAAGHGGSFTNQRVQPCLNYSVPMYSKYKFLSNNPATRSLGSDIDDTTDDSHTVRIQYISPPTVTTNQRVKIDFYCGIGTDFSSVFFLNVPTVFQLSTPPAAP